MVYILEMGGKSLGVTNYRDKRSVIYIYYFDQITRSVQIKDRIIYEIFTSDLVIYFSFNLHSDTNNYLLKFIQIPRL